MQPIRMGMIGGGEGAFIGAVHRHAAGLDGNYQLVCGAFSRNEENNMRTASALNVSTSRTYGSWQTMLEEEAKLPEQQRMQVVVIVTPNHLHVPISLAAIKAGFHVFCEKPAGVSFAEVKELQDVIHASESLYGLAHTYLGYPMVWQARHLVESGKLGNIRKVYVEYPQGWLSGEEETHNKQAQWRTDPAISGATGALCGELNTHVEGRRLDDDGAALIKTKKGASGVLIASQVRAGEENTLKIRVYGDKGGLEWRQMEPNSVIYRPVDAPYQVFRAGQGQVGLCDAASARCRVPAGHPEGYLEAMANLYTDFAKAVRANQKGKADGVPGINSGIRGMVFIDAMLASTDSDTKWESVSQEGTQ